MRVSKTRFKEKGADGQQAFVRKTITIQEDLASFADAQAALPEHAGNVSSYVRNLIIQDRMSREQKKAA